MKTLLLIVVLFTVAFVSVAQAGYYETGTDLMQGWRALQKYMQSLPGEKEPVRAFQFMGYVAGVVDAERNNLQIPDGATKDQVCSIVGKYLEAHPEEWNKVGSDLVLRALRTAFGERQ